jgi:uncharacterized SAM-binding protein YcdF (DUF218 family)
MTTSRGFTTVWYAPGRWHVGRSIHNPGRNPSDRKSGTGIEGKACDKIPWFHQGLVCTGPMARWLVSPQSRNKPIRPQGRTGTGGKACDDIPWFHQGLVCTGPLARWLVSPQSRNKPILPQGRTGSGGKACDKIPWFHQGLVCTGLLARWLVSPQSRNRTHPTARANGNRGQGV